MRWSDAPTPCPSRLRAEGIHRPPGELAAQMLAVIEGGIVMGRVHGDSERVAVAIGQFRRYLASLLD